MKSCLNEEVFNSPNNPNHKSWITVPEKTSPGYEINKNVRVFYDKAGFDGGPESCF